MSDKHVLVTFLGAPDRGRPPTRRPRPHYQEVIYDFRECKPPSVPGLYQERFFPFALREHLDKTGDALEEMVVFGTPGSAWDEFLLNVGIPGLLGSDLDNLRRQASRDEIQEKDLKDKWAERVGKALRLGTVQLKVIDYAKVLDDQVAIIAMLNEATESATAISIDVTHGLRYMPLLGSLAAYVVETTRGSPTLAAKGSAANVKGVWYGALDLKKPDNIGQEIAPAIDVGGLSRIVDWLAAFKNFEWDGDYSAFAEPLKKGDIEEQESGKLLAEAAFFERLGRFDEAQKTFKKFDEKIKTVLEKAPGAHGLIGLFKDQLRERIALSNLNAEDLYKHQCKLAWHHLDHEDVVHAAIWGREAAVTRIVPALTAQYIVWVNNLPETNRNEKNGKESAQNISILHAETQIGLLEYNKFANNARNYTDASALVKKIAISTSSRKRSSVCAIFVMLLLTPMLMTVAVMPLE